jgi:hypothetical protein
MLDENHGENKFLNKFFAYVSLGKIYDNNEKISPTFKKLLKNIFDNKDVIKHGDCKKLAYDINVLSKRISIGQLQTTITKSPLLKTKYKANLEITSNEIYDERPIIIVERNTDQFVGLILLKDFGSMFRDIGNMLDKLSVVKNKGERLV